MQNNEQKFVELLSQLRDRTRENKVKWSPSIHANVVQASFPHHTVQIEVQPYPLKARYLLRILNGEGTLIEEMKDSQLESSFPDSRQILDELFVLARRQAFGVDQAIDELVEFLKR